MLMIARADNFHNGLLVLHEPCKGAFLFRSNMSAIFILHLSVGAYAILPPSPNMGNPGHKGWWWEVRFTNNAPTKEANAATSPARKPRWTTANEKQEKTTLNINKKIRRFLVLSFIKYFRFYWFGSKYNPKNVKTLNIKVAKPQLIIHLWK